MGTLAITTAIVTSKKTAEPNLGVRNINASELNDGDFSHVQPVIDRLPDSLTEDQRQQA